MQNTKLSEWKFLGETKGNTKLTLPDSFSELSVYVYLSTNIAICMHIIAAELSSVGKVFRSGYFGTNSITGMTSVLSSLTEIYVNMAYFNETNILNTATLKIYYR